MINAYSEMLAKVPDLRSAPTLEFYDDLRGVGGLFIADRWVIAIGVKDMEDIADRVVAHHGVGVARIVRALATRKMSSVTDVRTVMLGAGMGRWIAHELGHALLHRGLMNPFDPDVEAGADHFAGRLDAARGSDWRLGEMFFRAIGCIRATCDHPSPEGRTNAYLTGYRQQSRHAA